MREEVLRAAGTSGAGSRTHSSSLGEADRSRVWRSGGQVGGVNWCVVFAQPALVGAWSHCPLCRGHASQWGWPGALRQTQKSAVGACLEETLPHTQ